MFDKVLQRLKAVAGINAFLVLPVAAFHFAVVARGIGAIQGLQCSGGGPPSHLPGYAVRDRLFAGRAWAGRAWACRLVHPFSSLVQDVS